MKRGINHWILRFGILTAVFILSGSFKESRIENEIYQKPAGTVTDIDGNVYHCITIGTQVWMVENLKVTKYRNGDPIPIVSDKTQWGKLQKGACCIYENKVSNNAIYGKLYNWYAVNDSRNIAPKGWHVPTDAEWMTLINYLGGETVAGGKMKETGTALWLKPNAGATNSSGFKALPGGTRGFTGIFNTMRYYCVFWSSTQVDEYQSYSHTLNYIVQTSLKNSSGKQFGFSIRCVKD
jgi:uncharacterized protein (TIGR02145 family)